MDISPGWAAVIIALAAAIPLLISIHIEERRRDDEKNSEE